MHKSVLLKETIEILNPQPGEFFIDGTLGSAGHAIEIIKRISPNGIFLGIDWDKEAIAKCKSQIANRKNVILVNGNYADLPEILRQKKLGRADGLLLDLGMSSEQLEKSGRGFTFQKNEPLDMRYDTQITAGSEILDERALRGSIADQRESATAVINNRSEKELADIFFKYGEERFSRQIARKIIEERKKKPMETTFDLVEIIQKAIPPSHCHRHSHRQIHPATRVFQALRIYVNDELGNLEKLLKNLDKIIKNKPSSEISAGPPKADKNVICRNSTTGKGRVAIISYHSLEDRLVKNYFRELKNQGKAVILTKKPIKPTFEEIRQNPRARSAKMRTLLMY